VPQPKKEPKLNKPKLETNTTKTKKKRRFNTSSQKLG
jgi:hypothetical protein